MTRPERVVVFLASYPSSAASGKSVPVNKQGEADMPDIVVANHGSIVLLRPVTAAGREWLEANCDRSGYQPFTGGTLLCEPRYIADIVAGARQAGLEVR